MPFDGTQLDETTRNLIRAKEILLEKGWCVGEIEDSAGRHCALGALVAANRGGDINAEWKRLNEAMPNGYSSIPHYNNTRTHIEQILAWFDKAIAAS